MNRFYCTLFTTVLFNSVAMAEYKPEFANLFKQIFTKSIAENHKVKGYAFALSDELGNIITSGSGGWARETYEQGGGIPFTIDVKTPIASISKMFSTAAILRIIEKSGGTITLQSKMENFLPYKWRGANLHEDFKKVTIEMLLQHKAGFTHSFSPEQMGAILNSGPEIPQDTIGIRSYSNASLGIFMYMMAYMIQPQLMETIEGQVKNLTGEAYANAILDQTTHLYIEYVNANIMQVCNINASCNAKVFSQYAYYYDNPESNIGGKQNGDGSRVCAPGGWVMSIKDILRFMYQFKYTTNIISNAMYKITENTNNIDNRIGWNRYENINGPAFGHGGLFLSSGSRLLRLFTFNLANGYQFAIVVNSRKGDLKETNLIEMLKAAYKSTECAIKTFPTEAIYTAADNGKLSADKQAKKVYTKSGAKVTLGQNVNLIGSIKVNLYPGFIAVKGSKLKMFISGCNVQFNDVPAEQMEDDSQLLDYYDMQNNIVYLPEGKLSRTFNEKVQGVENVKDETTIYPNPISDRLTIHYTLEKQSQVSLEIYDLHGRKVFSVLSSQPQYTGTYKKTINCNALVPGNYLLKLQISNTVITKKFIKI